MPVKLSQNAEEQLNGLLAAYPTSNNHPGTVIGVVNRQGELIYLGAAGSNAAGSSEAMKDDALFAIFSCTKVVTAVACMQLVERGLLDLDAPADVFVPELKDVEVIVSSNKKSVQTRKAKTRITTRMLLSHTSGYSYSWYNQHLKNWVDQNVQEFSGGHLGMPLVNEPGTKFEYGVSIDFAGLVVEGITKRKLGDYCQEHIFGPLGMDDSAFDLKDRPDLEARLASMHTWDGASTYVPVPHPRGIKEIPMQSGGGGLFSTASDFLLFLSTLLNEGRGPNGASILRPETVKTMFTNQCADVLDQGALGTHAKVETTDKTKANDALELLPGQRKGWGLSFLLNLDDVPAGRRAGSSEWGGVANLFWMADPTSEIAMIVFNSILPYGLPAFTKMEEDLQRVVYAAGALTKA